MIRLLAIMFLALTTSAAHPATLSAKRPMHDLRQGTHKDNTIFTWDALEPLHSVIDAPDVKILSLIEGLTGWQSGFSDESVHPVERDAYGNDDPGLITFRSKPDNRAQFSAPFRSAVTRSDAPLLEVALPASLVQLVTACTLLLFRGGYKRLPAKIYTRPQLSLARARNI